MTDLEDRILNGKPSGYCSSSDDDDEEQTPSSVQAPSSAAAVGTGGYGCRSSNTGPKGVLEDWRRYKQLCTEKNDEQQRELTQLAQRLNVDSKKETGEVDLAELHVEDEDEFVKEYMQRRLAEMKAALLTNQNSCLFGKVYLLEGADDYLMAIDKHSLESTVIIHLFEKENGKCEAMDACLNIICEQYPRIRFCKVLASALGASANFCRNGVPALQAYRDGQLIGNFVRTSDELGADCYATDVEAFLQEYGLLPDSGSTQIGGSTSDSD